MESFETRSLFEADERLPGMAPGRPGPPGQQLLVARHSHMDHSSMGWAFRTQRERSALAFCQYDHSLRFEGPDEAAEYLAIQGLLFLLSHALYTFGGPTPF